MAFKDVKGSQLWYLRFEENKGMPFLTAFHQLSSNPVSSLSNKRSANSSSAVSDVTKSRHARAKIQILNAHGQRVTTCHKTIQLYPKHDENDSKTISLGCKSHENPTMIRDPSFVGNQEEGTVYGGFF
eukprot:scaffold2939_cov123-Cylindrotheca_fusiformis.AAC.10